MSIIDFLLAIISVVSFVLAVASFIRTQIKKANERANMEIMKEKLKALYQGMGALFHTTDGIVQRAKVPDVKVEELQNIARVLRGQIYFLLEDVKKYRDALEKWRFGLIIKSEPPLDIAPKEDQDPNIK